MREPVTNRVETKYTGAANENKASPSNIPCATTTQHEFSVFVLSACLFRFYSKNLLSPIFAYKLPISR